MKMKTTTMMTMKMSRLRVTGAVSGSCLFESSRCPFLCCHRCCVVCDDQGDGGGGCCYHRRTSYDHGRGRCSCVGVGRNTDWALSKWFHQTFWEKLTWFHESIKRTANFRRSRSLGSPWKTEYRGSVFVIETGRISGTEDVLLAKKDC